MNKEEPANKCLCIAPIGKIEMEIEMKEVPFELVKEVPTDVCVQHHQITQMNISSSSPFGLMSEMTSNQLEVPDEKSETEIRKMTKEERRKQIKRSNKNRNKALRRKMRKQLQISIPLPAPRSSQCILCIEKSVENPNESSVDSDIQIIDTVTTLAPVKITEVGNEDSNLTQEQTLAQMEPASKKRKTEGSIQEELMVLACEHLKSNESDYDKISKAWAVELQKLSSEQQIHAKKAINDILYEGQLGNLFRNCVEIIPKGLLSSNPTSTVPSPVETHQQRSSRHLLEQQSYSPHTYQHLSSHHLLNHRTKNLQGNFFSSS